MTKVPVFVDFQFLPHLVTVAGNVPVTGEEKEEKEEEGAFSVVGAQVLEIVILFSGACRVAVGQVLLGVVDEEEDEEEEEEEEEEGGPHVLVA
jgi:hypothetical protein